MAWEFSFLRLQATHEFFPYSSKVVYRSGGPYGKIVLHGITKVYGMGNDLYVEASLDAYSATLRLSPDGRLRYRATPALPRGK